MAGKQSLFEHLKTGATTTCHAWSVVRRDGSVFGFTDHDSNLEFEEIIFKANSGLTGGALQQSSGLAVDNTEIAGALKDDGITEADLAAGRFDGAEVTTWIVNWSSVEDRIIRFRGHFGEIQRSSGSFKVELRGLTEALNQQRGRTYQPNCPAVLGDAECRFDIKQSGFSVEASVQSIAGSNEYVFKTQRDYPDQWFERGIATITSGRAKDIQGIVKFDREMVDGRHITMWVDFDAAPEIGDLIRFEAGCDKRASTCRTKFHNFLNFRGFPNIPSSDWVASYPISSQRNDGGSRQK